MARLYVPLDVNFPDDEDPWDFMGATPLPMGREVMPLAEFPPDHRVDIALAALSPERPAPYFDVEGTRRPLARLSSRAWYEWHWLRGIDPDRIHRQKISEWLRAAVYERDGYRCVTCAAGEPLTLDHIFPWSLGGEDTYDNFQTMCQPCNSRKGAKV